MVIRSAVGALVAVGALGAVALALPEHNPAQNAGKPDAPFGILQKDKAPAATPAVSASLADQSKLIKLASLKSEETQGSVVTAPQAQSASADLSAPAPLAYADQPGQAVAPKTIAETDPTRADAASAVAHVVASADPAPSVAPKPTPARPVTPQPAAPVVLKKAGTVDINRASADTLDRLPGGARIGVSIVKHRPYKSVADLVHKRVLRMSDFQRIQSAISVD